MMKAVAFSYAAALAVVLGLPAPASAASTVDHVKEHGVLTCGVSGEHPGFSSVDDGGVWRGFDVDVCRAVAAAVLGERGRVDFVQLNAQTRLDALVGGEIDMLSRTTTWTLSRDTGKPINFAAVTLYDGQGFMAHVSRAARTVKEMGPVTVCVSKGTTSLDNLKEWAAINGLPVTLIERESYAGQYQAFFERQCDLFTNDRTGLVSLRATIPTNPQDFVLLDDIISKEPLGPAVRNDDDRWFDAVKWVANALIAAEEQGLTSANIERRREEVRAAPASVNKEARILLGLEPGSGAGMGLNDDWAYQAVRAVGNYAEVFERNLGSSTPLKLDRGLNRLQRDGGILYALPLR